MEKLEVKQFGPLVNIDIVVRDINVFIGTTSSGKSTAAKLLTIFRSGMLRQVNCDLSDFKSQLSNVNIDFEIDDATEIYYTYQWEGVTLSYQIYKQKFKSNYTTLASGNNFLHPYQNPVYIPSERLFVSTFAESIFNFLKYDIQLPKWLIDFSARIENARNTIREIAVDFMGFQYLRRDGVDHVKMVDGTLIRLSQASSGIQSILPLLLVLKYYTSSENNSEDMFVIEEPELNLYPSSQKDLIEHIIERIKVSDDKLIITTHSPYLLTSLDNLIQAGTIAKENPHLKSEIEAIIPQNKWIEFEKVSCYYFQGGSAITTLDEELQSIGPSKIDDVSIDLSAAFDKLLDLKYPNA